MKSHFIIIAATAAFLFGCEAGHEHADDEHADAADVKLFEKGKGIRLPVELERSLGVKTVEVSQRRISRRGEKPIQVFRAGGESQTAAGILWLDESETARIQIGNLVSVREPGGETFTGAVAAVAHSMANLLGRSEAVVEISDPERRLRAGALLTATLGVSTNAGIAVPAEAVVRGVEGAFVYALRDSYYARTPVTLGGEDGGWVEVTEGLRTGDVVVARAVDALWTIELCALKGGTPCCPVGRKPGHHED